MKQVALRSHCYLLTALSIGGVIQTTLPKCFAFCPLQHLPWSRTSISRFPLRRVQSSNSFMASVYDECEFQLSPRRIQEDARREKSRFVQGDDLYRLRSDIATMRQRLLYARAVGHGDQELALRSTIEIAEGKDAELVLGKSITSMKKSLERGMFEEAKKYEKEANTAKDNIPHLNMEGLWVGRYRPEGLEMINITYVGDTLVATKVAGRALDTPASLRKGEVAFMVDMTGTPATIPSSARKVSQVDAPQKQTMRLPKDAAEGFGVEQVRHFPGVGGIPRRAMLGGTKASNNKKITPQDSQHRQWEKGQLIMLGDRQFSFAWIPHKYQVFFARPPPSVVMELLEEAYKIEDFRNLLAKQMESMSS